MEDGTPLICNLNPPGAAQKERERSNKKVEHIKPMKSQKIWSGWYHVSAGG